MKSFACCTLLLLAVTGVIAQSPAAAPAAAQCTPLITAAQNSGFEAFLAAFNASGLTAAAIPVGATFFVPTNEAFATLLASNNLTLSALPPKLLQDIILAHVIPGAEIFAANITASAATVPSALSESEIDDCPANVTARLSGGNAVISTAVSNATVVTPDIRVCEGVAHAVNAVLVPCNLTTLVAAAAAEGEGAAPEGAEGEGSVEGEGMAPEGAAEGEGTAPEGAAPEGAEGEGRAPEGAEGAAPEGAAPEGAEGEGAAAPSPSTSRNVAQSPLAAPSAAGSIAAGAVAVACAAVAALAVV